MADDNTQVESTDTGLRVKVFSSEPLASVDAPEPSMSSGVFVYNYFTKGERVEYGGGSGFTTRSFLSSSMTNGAAPRYVEISFKKPSAEREASTTSEVMNALNGGDLFDLAQQGLIHVEDSITSQKFQRIQITAAGLDIRAVSAISGSSSYVTDDQGTERASNPELARKIADSISGARGTIPADLAAVTAVSESDDEVRDAIIKYINLSGQAAQRISYYSGESRSQIEAKADAVTDRQETLGINRLVLDSVVRASSCNVNHLLNPEISEYRATSDLLQREARSASATAGISASAYDISITPYYTSNSTATSFRSTLVGYIVEKLEIKGGEVIEHPSIVVTGSNVTTIRDVRVNYGSMFKYRVRAVFSRETAAVFSSSGRSGTAKFLVASSGESAEVFVPCVEEVPPPEPTDVRISYDYSLESLRLTWSLPVNPQRDIKYFQIFRRESTDRPFRLVSVIDFDDSGIKEPARETYPSRIVEQVQIVKCFYMDKIEQEKEYIYSICSVDAHGLSSGYSIQMGATFKRSRNAISSRIVSRSGAPKTYPNLYINEDTFADVVVSSHARRLTTFFDPEAIRIKHPDGKLENLVEDSVFTVSMINEDNCLARTVTLRSAKNEAITSYLSASVTALPEDAIPERGSESPVAFGMTPFR